MRIVAPSGYCVVSNCERYRKTVAARRPAVGPAMPGGGQWHQTLSIEGRFFTMPAVICALGV
ncbi:hypothetical protein [Xanthomonas arboricola]|uniref:hypothetical protein n=1 Tax=Xanthomonas arboricola TaxID=56448 RepID=UPI000E1F4AB7|nr:hypothetical protein [Xanthomonas arboricola]